MKQTIAIAGGTGNLGELIVKSSINKGAAVRAVVRPETEAAKKKKLEKLSVEVIAANLSHAEELGVLGTKPLIFTRAYLMQCANLEF